MKKILIAFIAFVAVMPLWAQTTFNENKIYIQTNREGGYAKIGWHLTSNRIVQDNFIKNGCHNYVNSVIIDGQKFIFNGADLGTYGYDINRSHKIELQFSAPITNFNAAFANCYNIEFIDMSHFDASQLVNISDFILGAISLKSIILPANLDSNNLNKAKVTSIDNTALVNVYCPSYRYDDYKVLFKKDSKILAALKVCDAYYVENKVKKETYTLPPLVSTAINNDSVQLATTADSTETKIPTDAISLLNMAKNYYITCEYDKAYKYFSMVADSGNIEAKYFVAQCYYAGLGVDTDKAKAVKLFNNIAKHGFTPVYERLGHAYEFGNGGLTKNKTKATTYYNKAIAQITEMAENGDAYMQYRLGISYIEGRGVKKNTEKYVKWCKLSAEQNNAFAMFEIGYAFASGEGVLPNNETAVVWWRKAANMGEVNSQRNLGWSYYFGKGVTRDYKEAVKWYKKAAEQGDDFALNALGECYYNGDGVTSDYSTAVIYYRKAAEKGNCNAQQNLGYCYCFGRGVTQNDTEAIMWYKKAIKNGNVTAMLNLGWMYSKGRGVVQNYAEAVKWYRKAADKGDATAQYNMGIMYYNGKGVAKAKAKAKVWFQKSADQGYQDAKDFLRKNY